MTRPFVVRFEGWLCQSPGAIQANGTRQGNVLDADDYDFDDWE